MSSGNTHKNAGILSGILAIIASAYIINYANFPNYPQHNPKNIPPLHFILAIPIAMIYSLLPDMDIKSKGSKIFFTIILIITTYLAYIQEYKIALTIFTLSLIPQLFPHRKFTHSTIFAILFPIPVYYIFSHFNIQIEYFIMFYISALLGYLSHIILDKF